MRVATRRPGSGTGTLAVEADPDRVECPEEEPAAAVVPIGSVELATDRVDDDRAERLGRNGERLAPDEAQPQFAFNVGGEWTPVAVRKASEPNTG